MHKLSRREKLLVSIGFAAALLFWTGSLWLLRLTVERYLPLVGLERAGLAHFIGALVGLLLVGYAFRLVHRGVLLARLRGDAIQLGTKQFPDLHGRIVAVCRRLGIEETPVTYVAREPRLIRARYLLGSGRPCLILDGDMVNALTDRQGAIEFLAGYALGFIFDPLKPWRFFLLPAMVLPLIGPALARARTYRYDRNGIAACNAKVDAAFAVAVEIGGAQRWKSLNIPQFAAQSADTRQFWTALFELLRATPWMSKRMAHLRAIATNSDTFIPRRHPLAYLVAVVIPHLGPGIAGVVRDAVLIAVWVVSVAFWGGFAYEQAKIRGYLASPDATETAAPRVTGRVEGAPETGDPYGRLHADLKTLGELMLARYRKHGGIPCEIGNIHALALNYQSNRYAFSCDEPIVYTLVGRGEFEPGKPAHLYSYNWKSGAFVEGPAADGGG